MSISEQIHNTTNEELHLPKTYTPTTTFQAGLLHINNFDEIKTQLEAKLKSYEGIEFTEEQASLCKGDIQDLRSVLNGIEDYRKKMKKEAEKPIKAFEAQCKELTGLIESTISPIKLQLDTFIAKEKELKREQVLTIIANLEFFYKIKFDDYWTFDDKWLNKTNTLANIRREIEFRILEKEKAIAQIDKLAIEISEKKGLKVPITASDYYCQDIDTAHLMMIQEAEKQLERENKLIENLEVKGEISSDIAVMESMTNTLDRITPIESNESEPLYTVTLELNATQAQIKALRAYLDNFNIEYSEVL